jgi:proteic killer suppression protein
MLQVAMIRTIRHKGLRRLLEDDDRSKLAADLVDRLEELLSVLSEANVLDDLALPSYRLHPRRGELKGFYAITVRANWRLIFRFEDGDVFDLDFVDYH